MSDLNRCIVVPVKLEKHPKADLLSIVRVQDYECVVNTAQFSGVTKAAYIYPDNTVPVILPEFAFLEETSKIRNGRARIRAKKIREVWSQGLLIPITDRNINIGDDVTELFQVERYVTEEDIAEELKQKTQSGNKPNIEVGKYDIESYFKYSGQFNDDEPVVITEKIHGQNFRAVFLNGKVHVGSRNMWLKNPLRKNEPKNLWEKLKTIFSNLINPLPEFDFSDPRIPMMASNFWRVFYENPNIYIFLKSNPGIVLYGEIYGSKVQKMDYGITSKSKKLGFAAFDAYDSKMNNGMTTGFWNFDFFKKKMNEFSIPIVPIVEENVPFSKQLIVDNYIGRSLVKTANDIREGIVIKPMNERVGSRFGRVILKAVSPEFLDKYK